MVPDLLEQLARARRQRIGLDIILMDNARAEARYSVGIHLQIRALATRSWDSRALSEESWL
jgi:hypothetical protein